MMRLHGLLASALALSAAIIPASVSASDRFEIPPYVPAYEPTDVDERGLWMTSDEYERVLQKSPLLIEDAELHDYVKSVLCQAVGTDRCRGVRIYIIEMPVFNASMMPNGVMQVNSGLLLRTHSEAELASVLAHEFGHFELRHGVMGFKRTRKTGDIMAWIGVLGGITSTGASALQYSLLGSIFTFNREQEEEADRISLSYLGASPYPSSSSPNVWANLMAEEDASNAGRKLKKKHKYSAGFFATHPSPLKRLDYLSEGAREIGDEGDPGVERHQAAIQPFLPQWLDAENKLNDFGGTTYILDSLAGLNGWSADLLFARAKLYQTRGHPRDLVSAEQFFRQALGAGYQGPEIYRELGLVLLKNRREGEAAPLLSEYLRQVPTAPDASIISSLLPAGTMLAETGEDEPRTTASQAGVLADRDRGREFDSNGAYPHLPAAPKAEPQNGFVPMETPQ